MEYVYFLLGGNLGDRLKTLKQALSLLADDVGEIVQYSSIYETEPWGKYDQPIFLNQTACLKTNRSPQEIMETIRNIEQQLKRQRYEKWGSRTIDIDILFYGKQIIEEPDLKIPHPALHERNFTLVPLNELAPDFVHPILGKTVSQMTSESPDSLDAYIYKPVENLDMTN